MFDRHLSQLKSLQGESHGPSTEAVELGLMKLRATMAAHPLKISAVPEASSLASAFVWWKPATALAMSLVIVGSTGLTVSAAGTSNPGDSLYGVKILTEDVRGRLTFSPEERFRLLANQAESRLIEADTVISRQATPPKQKEKLLEQVMNRYVTQIVALRDLAGGFLKSNQPGADARIAAVGRVLQQHESLLNSASTTESKAQQTISAPVQAVVQLMATISVAGGLTAPDVKESDNDSHEHVDVEAPEVSAPVIHQPRLILNDEAKQWKKVENKIEDASVR
jgi:hypothetical protein